MKKLLLLSLFSGSLDGFSQVKAVTLPGQGDVFQQAELKATMNAICYHNTLTCRCGSGEVTSRGVVKPDTLRAIVLVTLFPNGVAHSRMGFVVIQDGKRPVYLDCRKKALKMPQVGWGYEIVNPNINKK